MSELSPFQFSMFIPAGDLANPEKYDHADLEPGGSFEGLRDHKLTTARSARKVNLYDNIRRNGVVMPVEVKSYQWKHNDGWQERGEASSKKVERPKVMNGHHRIFSANDIDPQMEVPVKWRQ